MKRLSVNIRDGEVFLERKVVSTRISKDDAAALTRLAKAQDRSFSSYLASLLEEHVEAMGHGC